MAKSKPRETGDEQWWTLKQTAKAWGCSVSRARALVEEGRVSGSKRIGGSGGGGLWLVPVGAKKPDAMTLGRPPKAA